MRLPIEHSPCFYKAAESIRKGTLPLGKGDVLNVSLGNNVAKDIFHQSIAGTGDPTYKELNDKLKPQGLTITPENLEANRDKLVKALETIAKDPHDKKWQAMAQAALDSNAALKKIDAMGVEVLHASGNDGTDHVDLNFLFARHQLASVDPATHKADKFSNANSLTEPGDGIIPIRREKPGRYLLVMCQFLPVTSAQSMLRTATQRKAWVKSEQTKTRCIQTKNT